MKKQRFVLTIALMLSWAGFASSQGRGQGGPGAGGGAGRGQVGQPGPGARGGPQSTGTTGRGEQQREAVRATQQQRTQYETCTQAATRVRDQARVMAQAAKGGGANNPEFLRQHEQLRQQIQAMQREHERFVDGLNAAQRDSLGKRIQDMDKIRDRLQDRLRLLDGELAEPELDRKRIREHASEIEKAMNDWQKQYRGVGSKLEVTS